MLPQPFLSWKSSCSLHKHTPTSDPLARCPFGCINSCSSQHPRDSGNCCPLLRAAQGSACSSFLFESPTMSDSCRCGADVAVAPGLHWPCTLPSLNTFQRQRFGACFFTSRNDPRFLPTVRKAPGLPSQEFNQIKARATGAGRAEHLKIHNSHEETKAVSKNPPQTQHLPLREWKEQLEN